MITKAFSIYDTKAKVFANPFFAPTTPAAIRSFGDLANDRQSSVNRHPADYILYEIGSYDDNDGIMTALVPPANLGVASNFLEESPRVKLQE